MSGADVRVIGADTFRRTMGAAADDLGRMDRAADATGRLILTRARARAPKRSGRLSGSLTAKADGSDVAVGSGLVYAPVIHNGWAGHSIAPNPFLIPVAQESQPVWLGYFRADLGRVIAQVRGA